jgi:hypothetical protein
MRRLLRRDRPSEHRFFANMGGQFTNLVLGIWLCLATVFWQQDDPAFRTNWFLGLLITFFAGMGLVIPAVAYVNLITAIALLLSVFTVHQPSLATGIHNGLLAVVVFACALLTSRAYAPFHSEVRTPLRSR